MKRGSAVRRSSAQRRQHTLTVCTKTPAVPTHSGTREEKRGEDKLLGEEEEEEENGRNAVVLMRRDTVARREALESAPVDPPRSVPLTRHQLHLQQQQQQLMLKQLEVKGVGGHYLQSTVGNGIGSSCNSSTSISTNTTAVVSSAASPFTPSSPAASSAISSVVSSVVSSAAFSVASYVASSTSPGALTRNRYRNRIGPKSIPSDTSSSLVTSSPPQPPLPPPPRILRRRPPALSAELIAAPDPCRPAPVPPPRPRGSARVPRTPPYPPVEDEGEDISRGIFSDTDSYRLSIDHAQSPYPASTAVSTPQRAPGSWNCLSTSTMPSLPTSPHTFFGRDEEEQKKKQGAPAEGGRRAGRGEEKPKKERGKGGRTTVGGGGRRGGKTKTPVNVMEDSKSKQTMIPKTVSTTSDNKTSVI